MEGHSTAPVRSRSSQSPSPSHSASASASSSVHLKRKFLPSSTDDLDSISAREDEEEEEDDTDEEDDELEEDEPEDEDDELEDEDNNNESIRTFNSARLKPPKPENNVKAEPLDTSGQQNNNLITGISVKDDPAKGIFTENLQASGAYSAREEGLKREEDAGRLKFLCYENDGDDQHMIWLIGLKNIFARQLPNMPKEYIVRLVMDR